jgi:Uma2 family endonuclease
MSAQTEIVQTPNASVLSPTTGQQIILHGVSWETYEQLLSDFQDSHAAHFTYDRGVLEIMVLSFKHETVNRTLAHLVSVIAEELQIDTISAGSTTFKRQDLAKGFEPDSCFYIQNEGRISGKAEIDLDTDPPPDLIIEIDISSSSLNKFPVYAHIGVPEVWRYDGTRVVFFVLAGENYEAAEESRAFPVLTSAMATELLDASAEVKSTAWVHRVRQWVRQAGQPS